MDLNVYIQLIFLCVVNVMFLCTGIILNTLVIVSYWKSSAYLRNKVCYFVIMVLSCFDLLVVITKHPLSIVHLVLWLNEEHHLVTVTEIYRHFSDLFIGFSIIALLVMNIERYLGVYYPFFHRTSVTRRRLLTLLAVLCILPIILFMISLNDLVISFSVGLIIFFAIVFPPIIFLNYKLFKISRKVRRDNTASPEPSTLHVNLKNIHTCLLAVACLVLMYIPTFFFIAFNIVEKSTSENTTVSRFWSVTVATTNSTLNCVIFFWKNDVLRREGKKILKTLKNRLFPC
jgi:hypothetical protein